MCTTSGFAIISERNTTILYLNTGNNKIGEGNHYVVYSA